MTRLCVDFWSARLHWFGVTSAQVTVMWENVGAASLMYILAVFGDGSFVHQVVFQEVRSGAFPSKRVSPSAEGRKARAGNQLVAQQS